MPRPTKYNPAVAGLICDALKLGASRTAAAEFAEISYDTFKRWFDGNAEFCGLVKKAEAELQIRLTTKVIAAAEAGSWQAAMTMLERRFGFTRPKDGQEDEKPDASKLLIGVDLDRV